MQTLMVFWSSWRLEMIVSERQQSRHVPGNNVQTDKCMDLDKAKLMIQSNWLYKVYRDKQGAYSRLNRSLSWVIGELI